MRENIRDIVQRDAPVLRLKAKPVPPDEIVSPRIAKIIADMKAAMHGQKDGIAIAAPQIGESLRIFAVSGDLLKKADPAYRGDGSDLIFINPEITRLSRDKREVEEGCLSVRWIYGRILRATRASVKAYDENGKKVLRGGSGLLAQIFQHECDHLDGTLFTDKARELWEMTEEEKVRLASGG